LRNAEHLTSCFVISAATATNRHKVLDRVVADKVVCTGHHWGSPAPAPSSSTARLRLGAGGVTPAGA
jgi:hypothetical protein